MHQDELVWLPVKDFAALPFIKKRRLSASIIIAYIKSGLCDGFYDTMLRCYTTHIDAVIDCLKFIHEVHMKRLESKDNYDALREEYRNYHRYL